MTIEIGLALIAFSAPVTAIILVYLPRRNGKNGKYVTVQEYYKDRIELGDDLILIDVKLSTLGTQMQDLTTAVKSHLG